VQLNQYGLSTGTGMECLVNYTCKIGFDTHLDWDMCQPQHLYLCWS